MRTACPLWSVSVKAGTDTDGERTIPSSGGCAGAFAPPPQPAQASTRPAAQTRAVWRAGFLMSRSCSRSLRDDRAVASAEAGTDSGATGAGALPKPTRFYRFVVWISRPIVGRLFRLQVGGGEHVPATGGFVVAANHTSNLDPWPLGMALWPRSLHFMAKHELWRPPLKWVIRAAGSFPV